MLIGLLIDTKLFPGVLYFKQAPNLSHIFSKLYARRYCVYYRPPPQSSLSLGPQRSSYTTELFPVHAPSYPWVIPEYALITFHSVPEGQVALVVWFLYYTGANWYTWYAWVFVLPVCSGEKTMRSTATTGLGLRGFCHQLKKSLPSGTNYKLSPYAHGRRFI